MQTVVLPAIIQGGMGVGISDWRLARAVSLRGQLGVVSASVIDTILVRRLQDGDAGGHMRRALEHFPIPRVAKDALDRYFLPAGRPADQPYKALPMYQQVVNARRQEITMLAAFAEVFLAKEGHQGLVGINLLTKVQMPTLATLYGAMLAGVDYVLMGAGIPREIPAVLDALAEHQPVSLAFDIEGPPTDVPARLTLNPQEHWDSALPVIRRPMFLAIIASNSLATMLARKASGRVDGFVVEGPTAGGHNAPPRGETQYNERGEPIYGQRDEVDLVKLGQVGLPFWLAGGMGSPEGLRYAREAGAAGIQVGTLFAYCEESGLAENFKRSVLAAATQGEVDVMTDPRASPTGYPFKVTSWSDDPSGEPRERVCDLGHLRSAYRLPDGKIGYRCAAEPIDSFVRKGGNREETEGRKCLCNALIANIGLGQVREGGQVEPPLITSGDHLRSMAPFLAGRSRYSASDVIDYLLSDPAASA